MTLTTHTSFGALIGQMIPHPLLAFLLGFFLHLLVDIIPHGDRGLSDNFRIYKKKKKKAIAYVLLDAIAAIFFVLLILNTKPFLHIQTVTWGIIGSILPDLLVGIYECTKTKYLRWFVNIHFFFHNSIMLNKKDIPLNYALLGQLLLIFLLQSKL